MTELNTGLLLDLVYHCNQRVDDPIALARYCEAREDETAAASLRLAAIAACDCSPHFVFPPSLVDRILRLATDRLNELHNLWQAGAITQDPIRSMSSGQTLNCSSIGQEILAKQETCPCPTANGVATHLR